MAFFRREKIFLHFYTRRRSSLESLEPVEWVEFATGSRFPGERGATVKKERIIDPITALAAIPGRYTLPNSSFFCSFPFRGGDGNLMTNTGPDPRFFLCWYPCANGPPSNCRDPRGGHYHLSPLSIVRLVPLLFGDFLILL